MAQTSHTMTAVERFYRVKFLLEKLKALQDEILGIEFALPEQAPQAAFDCLEEAAALLEKASGRLKSLPTQINLGTVLNLSVEAVNQQKSIALEANRCRSVGGNNVATFRALPSAATERTL